MHGVKRSFKLIAATVPMILEIMEKHSLKQERESRHNGKTKEGESIEEACSSCSSRKRGLQSKSTESLCLPISSSEDITAAPLTTLDITVSTKLVS